jgi:antibiotic biosynthesis monooxygenase (ABM) superfamily enzyme
MIKAKMKLALKIWVALYPSITLFLYLFGKALTVFSLPVKSLIITLVLVPWIVFAAVPMVDFLLNLFYKNGKKQ